MLVVRQCLHDHDTGTIRVVVFLDHEAKDVTKMVLENLFLLWSEIVDLAVLHELVAQIGDKTTSKKSIF